MQPEGRASERFRKALAAALLIVVAASMAATFAPSEFAGRWNRLARSLAGDRTSPAQGTGFWFGRDYAVFLEEVRRRTPASSTVAVLAPAWPDVYVYQAVYQLALTRAKTFLGRGWSLDRVARNAGCGTKRTFLRSFRVQTGLTPARTKLDKMSLDTVLASGLQPLITR